MFRVKDVKGLLGSVLKLAGPRSYRAPIIVDTGLGKHSTRGVPVLGPAVQKFLKKGGFLWSPGRNDGFFEI